MERLALKGLSHKSIKHAKYFNNEHNSDQNLISLTIQSNTTSTTTQTSSDSSLASDMTDKLSTAIEQSVNKTVKNLDKMAISQANVSENDLDETIDSLNSAPCPPTQRSTQ